MADEVKMPPLPKPFFLSVAAGGFLSRDGWTADQMLAYGRACAEENQSEWIAAQREWIGSGVWVDLMRLSQERAAALDALQGRLAEAGAG